MYFYTILEKRQVLTMLKYEIKKVFSRVSCKIALLLLLVVLGITCYFAIGISYVNDAGVTETGLKAIHQLRADRKEWAGVLDVDKIRMVIRENAKINASPEAKSHDIIQNDIAYSKKQGLNDIRDLLNDAYADGFRDYNYYKADSLTVDDAKAFYTNRILLLTKWLNSDAKDQFSDAEKSYLVHQYEILKTPFQYNYTEGWTQLLEYAPTIIMIAALILGYIVASIFSSEFEWKSDSIFFASYHGRKKAVTAKIKAGICIVSVVYFAFVLLYSGIVLLFLGIDGGVSPIQSHMSGWKSFYNITFWQDYLLTVFGGYIGCLFMSSLTMFVSAKSKSAVLAVIVPFVLIFIPSFVGGIDSPIVNQVLGLLPDRLLQVSTAIHYFDLYQIGGKVIGAIPVILILYSVLSIILLPIINHEYRHKQIN